MSCRSAFDESQLDRDGALVWAEAFYREHGHWPTRRYRVVSPQGSKTRLLTKAQAAKAEKEYGGYQEELVPSTKEYRAICGQTGRACVLPPKKRGKR